MFDLDNLVELVLDNVKKLFFPEEWIEYDLKFSKFEIFTMLYIEKKREVTMSELVEYINTPMSTATGIVDRLVRSGYIKRERGETDRRIVVLQLTEEGTRLIVKLKDTIFSYFNLVIDNLTEEEKQFLTHLVIKIVNSLQEKMKSKVPDRQKEAAVKSIEIE